MNFGRISSSFLSNQAVGNLQTNLQSLSTIQEKLSSGKNINRASDDPIGLTQLFNLSHTLDLDSQYTKNINDAISELNITDSAMSGMTDLIQRAKELAVQGANTPTGASGRTALAQEVDGIINQMVQLGNTNVSGKYIFAGMKTSTPPFTRTSNNVAYSGTDPAESFARTVEISQSVTATVNVNGQTLLGTVTTGGSPEAVTAGSGIMRTLTALKLALQQDSVTGVSTQLDNLTTDLNTVLSQQAQIGATANRLQLTQNRIDDRGIELTKQYGSIQNVDMAKTISDLNFQQNVYQTSLGVTARSLQVSLLNYLN